jgi:formylglycine-generating enzyme required for sulfatase activity
MSSSEAAFKGAGGRVVDVGWGVSMRLVEIKPGRFTMGSPLDERDRDDDELQHEVTISKAFWMGMTEVTQAQWEAVMGTNPSRFTDNENCPVDGVTWNDAQEFCQRLSEKTGMNFRLPTEAEWEYACRAGTRTAYSFGNDASKLGAYAWFEDNSEETNMAAPLAWWQAGPKSKPVATKRPNAWGLYDMHGNVFEWVQDRYGSYPSGAATDPQGARIGLLRVARGGEWSAPALGCRSAFRIGGPSDASSDGLGFRVAMTP